MFSETPSKAWGVNFWVWDSLSFGFDTLGSRFGRWEFREFTVWGFKLFRVRAWDLELSRITVWASGS